MVKTDFLDERHGLFIDVPVVEKFCRNDHARAIRGRLSACFLRDGEACYLRNNAMFINSRTVNLTAITGIHKLVVIGYIPRIAFIFIPFHQPWGFVIVPVVDSMPLSEVPYFWL